MTVYEVKSESTGNVYSTSSRAEYVNLKAAGYRDVAESHAPAAEPQAQPAPRETTVPLSERRRREQPTPRGAGSEVSADEIDTSAPAGA